MRLEVRRRRRNAHFVLQAPGQHAGENLRGVEQSLLLVPALGERVRKVDELREMVAVGLNLDRGGIADFHWVHRT